MSSAADKFIQLISKSNVDTASDIIDLTVKSISPLQLSGGDKLLLTEDFILFDSYIDTSKISVGDKFRAITLSYGQLYYIIDIISVADEKVDRKQDRLIAGTNITISDDNVISASGGGGGTSNYNNLSNKPQINSVTLSGNKTTTDLFTAGDNISFNGKIISATDTTYSSGTNISISNQNVISTSAEVNVIEDVKVNGTSQTVTSKSVNISVPTDTSDLTNTAGYITNSVSDLTNYTTTTDMNTALSGKLDTSLKGANSGLAELDASGKVPTAQLPSYVDDVIEGYYYNGKFYEEASHTTEITPNVGKIYVDLDTNKTYRWGGSEYTEISASLALGETSSTAYRGDRGKTAYNHATETRLTTAKTSGLYKIATTTEGHIASATAVEKADITALGIPAQDTTYTAGTNITIDANDDNKISTSAQVNVLEGVQVDGTDLTITNKKVNITGKENTSNKVTSISSASTDTQYPSAKLVYDQLATKQGTLTAGSNITISSGIISATDTTYSDFTGTDGSTAGTSGLVPAPTTSDSGKYLKADGTWSTPSGGGGTSDYTDLTNKPQINSVTLSGNQTTADLFTAGSNITFSGGTISATDTTYESKAAAEDGTDVSLVTTGEKFEWNNKFTLPANGIPKAYLAIGVKTSLEKADTALQSSAIANMEVTTNKVTSVSSSSTDTQYPTAKCLYDLCGDVESVLQTLNSGSGV